MCWNQEVSLGVATAGYIGSYYLKKKSNDSYCWTPIAYFASMELLQGLTYFVINDCSNPVNKLLTVLSYLHICFQPIFSNIFFMYFIPVEKRRSTFNWVIPLCLITSVLMLQKLNMYDGCRACHPEEVFCSNKICSYFGGWHIGWELVMNDNSFYTPNWLKNLIPGGPIVLSPHFIAMFLLPLFYGNWLLVFFLFMTGPYFAMSITNDKNEWASIWCLFSTTQMSLMLLATRLKAIFADRIAKYLRHLNPVLYFIK
jgi:hypothetical protein